MTWTLTPELEEDILQRLESGEGLAQICKDEGMPSRSTVLRWQRDNDDFAAKCVHAREAQGDLAAEEQDEIAMRTLRGEIAPDVARVVLSAKQWRASKLAPKKYGDRQQIDLDAKHNFERLTEEQLDAEIRRRAAEAGVGLAPGGEGPQEE